MRGILKKLKLELGLIFFSCCLGLIPYVVVAVILSIFRDSPTYDHWLPLSVGAATSLLVWFLSHLEMR